MTFTFHGARDDVTKIDDDTTSDVTGLVVGFYGPIIILTKTPLFLRSTVKIENMFLCKDLELILLWGFYSSIINLIIHAKMIEIITL